MISLSKLLLKQYSKQLIQSGERQARQLERQYRAKHLEYLDVTSEIHKNVKSQLKNLESRVFEQGLLVKSIKESNNNDKATEEKLKSAIKALKKCKSDLSKKETEILSNFIEPPINTKKFHISAINQFFFKESFQKFEFNKGLLDYGPAGIQLRRNIEDVIQKKIILGSSCGFQSYEVETPSLSPEKVFINSGHVEKFNDWVVKNKAGEFIRIDHLLNSQELQDLTLEQAYEKILDKYPKKKYSSPMTLQLMYQINSGLGNYYLRPETAQGSILTFNSIYEFNNQKLPFSIYQKGRAFRNESSAQSTNLKRMKEFNLFEIQTFYCSDNDLTFSNNQITEDQNKSKCLVWTKDDQMTGILPQVTFLDPKICQNSIILHFMNQVQILIEMLNLSYPKVRFRQHLDDELAHYSSECWDLEVQVDNDWLECIGISDRGIYDCQKHDIKILDNQYPKIVETSFGLDRLTYAVLIHNFKTRLSDQNRNFFTFPVEIAPFKIGITMANNDNKSREKVKDIQGLIQREIGINCRIIQNNSHIGKQYYQLDELGVPFIITVDRESFDEGDGSVTIRYRDTLDQKRIGLDRLVSTVNDIVTDKLKFDDL